MSPRVSAAALMLVTAAALSQTPTPPPAPAGGGSQEYRLRGPIKITAERAELDHRQTALYRGNVKLTSPDLVLTGDRLELKQPVRGQFEALLTGRPARLTHHGVGQAPAVSAQARQIVYDTRTSVVNLTGGAQLERGADTVSSETIRYELAQRRNSASGAEGGQVQIVIEQPEGLKLPGEAAPAPAPVPEPARTPPPAAEPGE